MRLRRLGVLTQGDGVADALALAGGDDVAVVEAAVGPHGELTRGPGVAHAAHRLPQEVIGAPSSVGSTLAQSGHQRVPGTRSDGKQRVIAPHASVVVPLGAFPGQVRRFHKWWSPGRWSADRRPVRRQRSTPGPAAHGSPDPVGARGPTGSSAERSPAWTELSPYTPAPARFPQPAARRHRLCNHHRPGPMTPTSASCR